MGKSVMSIQGTSMFTITPSDSSDVAADPNNTNGATFVYLHNVSAGATLKVNAVDDANPQTIYIPQGGVFPVAIKRVWASPAPPAGLIGISSKSKV